MTAPLSTSGAMVVLTTAPFGPQAARVLAVRPMTRVPPGWAMVSTGW